MTAGIIGGLLDKPDRKDGQLPVRTTTDLMWRRISCLILVQFFEFTEKCTNTSHFIEERALWKH